jgi:hypothetical protein
MEETMKTQRIPATDSIEELARFWDNHDLTDFEDQLDEVLSPLFVWGKEAAFAIALKPTEVQALRRIAEAEGVKDTMLVREWVREKLRATLSEKPPNKRMEPTRSGPKKRAAHS